VPFSMIMASVRGAWKKRAWRCYPNLAARTEDRIGPRFRLSSRDLSGHGGCLLLRFRACRKGTIRELMKGGSRACSPSSAKAGNSWRRKRSRSARAPRTTAQTWPGENEFGHAPCKGRSLGQRTKAREPIPCTLNLSKSFAGVLAEDLESYEEIHALRNVGDNYPFESSRGFPGAQPNSGYRDHSRLSCGS